MSPRRFGNSEKKERKDEGPRIVFIQMLQAIRNV